MHRLLFVVGLVLTVAGWPALAAVSADSQIEVVEFYNEKLDHYFITADPKEIADLDGGVHAGWARTGMTFQAVKAGAQVSNSAPICRFYGKPESGLDSHFYAATTEECETLKRDFPDLWVFESGEVFRAFAVDPDTGKCAADTSPIHRLWNKRADVNHRYTDQLSVFETMVGKGYEPEGNGSPTLPVVFCVPTKAATVPAGSPVCTLTPSASTPTVGLAIILTASCTGTPSSYTWTGCVSSTSTCTATATTAGTVTYGVSATNLQGTGAAVTTQVDWKGSSGPLPICTLTAPTLVPNLGSSLVLSANCSQTPTRYDWYACSYLTQAACTIIPTCSATSSNCSINHTLPGLAHYAVAARNASGVGPRVGIDIDWKGAGTTPPPGQSGGPVCTLTASNSSPPLGSNVVLTASCSGSPTTYAWSATGCAASASTCTVTSSTGGTQTYTVVASNAIANGAPASVQVNWQAPATPQPPSCSLSASNTSPTTNQSITLTASCSGSPTSYTWTGCTSSGTQCTTTSANAGAVTYSVRGTNNNGQGNAASVTVNWKAPPAPPTAPPVCTLTPSTASPFTGQSVTLTASCSNQPTGYTWTGCNSSGSSCSVSSSSPGSQTISVRASNAIGPGSDVSVTLNWPQSSSAPDFCSQYSSDVVYLNKSWGGGPIYPIDYSNAFRANQVLVVRLDVPSSPSSYGTNAFSASVAEYQGAQTFRQVRLSRSPCDFGRGLDPTGQNGPIAGSDGTTATAMSSVGSSRPMQPGQTYYLSIRNYAQGMGNSCTTSTCNIIVGFQWPR
jgi:hypothetical protein